MAYASDTRFTRDLHFYDFWKKLAELNNYSLDDIEYHKHLQEIRLDNPDTWNT